MLSNYRELQRAVVQPTVATQIAIKQKIMMTVMCTGLMHNNYPLNGNYSRRLLAWKYELKLIGL